MAKREKRLAAIRRNPKNVRPDDLHAALVDAGFSWEQPGTSHRVYRKGHSQVSIPQRNPLKPEYVRDALVAIGREAGTEDEKEVSDGNEIDGEGEPADG